jgi:hypothetical protein
LSKQKSQIPDPPDFDPVATVQGAYSQSPADWQNLRAALEGGDSEGVRAAAHRLGLGRVQAGLLSLCLAEYKRLEATLEEVGDVDAEWNQAEVELVTLRRSHAATAEDAKKLAESLSETEARRNRLWALRSDVEVWINQLGSLLGLVPELFPENTVKHHFFMLPPAVSQFALEHKLDLAKWREHGRPAPATPPRRRLRVVGGPTH